MASSGNNRTGRLKGATTSTPKRAINNGREKARESRKNPSCGDRTGDLRRMMTGALPLLHGSCCMYCSCGLHDTVSSANRTSLERERGRKRERERERAQRDRHARSTRRFLRSHYEITVCDRIASNCSVWDPPKFEFEVEVVSPFKGGV